ncbi:helix-turn-helix transcriptional regulator [Arsenicicoccus dermatophilus]|uniref:helix-turn-helix transcriptional regulator n=1 Tax=Arsenicicoccus dermatophilus TaxID=1076331 RepID=UPI001F4CEEC1|nr:helix-turn-helix transcriptional regulator [Arsenicicoccus dermatophilus]MCH8611786.1 helix-turn-helix domain-containing protein [Arsenicicoccus dermatophilus]
MNDDETRDQRIGANVQRLREGMTQAALADSMRERGHKWSQATVWSVEKGDRPVRLTEAQDLAAILNVLVDDIGSTGDLRGDEELVECMDSLRRVAKRAALSLEDVDLWRRRMAKALEDTEQAMNEGAIPAEQLQWVRLSCSRARGMLKRDLVSEEHSRLRVQMEGAPHGLDSEAP